MKTTIDIPENILKEAMKHTGAKTKREVVVAAVEEFDLAERLHGSCPNFMSKGELQKMREHDKWNQ